MRSRAKNSIFIVFLVTVFAWAGCTSPGKRTAIGTGAGAGAGAAAGAAVGGWKGAGIGALIGAATGAAVGNYLDKQHKELERVVDAKRMKDGILVNLENDLLFKVDSAQLKPEAVTQLTELGGILKKYKEDRIRIAGFTDSTGPASYNKELSERRANSVRKVLRAQGVEDGQILIQGFGESKPVASNDTAKGRERNRRVELYIDVPADKADEVKQAQSEAAGDEQRVPASARDQGQSSKLRN